MTNDFWNILFTNSLANLLVGCALGALFTLMIWKRLTKFEQILQQKEKPKTESIRIIQYLELLKEEIDKLLGEIPPLRESFKKSKWGREIKLETPFWDVVKQNGELQRALSPDLLWFMANFYEALSYARRSGALIIQSWMIPQPDTVPGMEAKQALLIRMVTNSLDDAMLFGKELIGRVHIELASFAGIASTKN